MTLDIHALNFNQTGFTFYAQSSGYLCAPGNVNKSSYLTRVHSFCGTQHDASW